jgi:hypothetical protein
MSCVLFNNQAKYFTVHLQGASSNKLTHEVGFEASQANLKNP